MAKVTGGSPNLLNGVSQQALAQRLPSQGDICTNYYPTIVDGNARRPRTEHSATLPAQPAKTFSHIILRDQVEKYTLCITPTGQVKVFDMLGNAKTVINQSSTYLTSALSDPEANIRALTVADYTFIVNKQRTINQTTTANGARPFEALVSVLAGNYGKSYKILINGILIAEYTTPDGSVASHSNYISTEYIAAQLISDLGSNGYNSNNWSVGRYHSTIYIKNSAADFTVGTVDGNAGRDLRASKRVVQQFSSLPSHGPPNVVMQIAGTDSSAFDDYWVRYSPDLNSSEDSHWKECPAPSTPKGLAANTMPHILVRNADGTFTFKAATWNERQAGDLTNAPNPSFVGKRIEDLFFHRNRLGMLTGENVVLSGAGSFFNFFRSTMTTLLDTDPIDVAASHVKVAYLKHAVPYQDNLIIFSDRLQFRLNAKELLTPKTVSLLPLTEVGSSASERPVVSGTSLYFAAERDGYTAIYDYFVDRQTETADSDDVTSHVPNYIPPNIKLLIASPDTELVVVQSRDDPATLYCYKYFWQGQEKVQSAWFKWTFPECTKIVNAEFEKGVLILVLERGANWFIEKMDLNQRLGDLATNFKVYLDRHTLVSSGSFNATLDETTYTLPYTPTSETVLVAATGGVEPIGFELPIKSFNAAAKTITVEGSFAAQPVHAGINYLGQFRFSRLYYRGADGRNTKVEGRTQVRSMSISYSRSAAFRVDVTAEGRPVRTYTMTSREVSDPNSPLDTIQVEDGKIAFPVMSRNDRVTIDVFTERWLPCSLVSSHWAGTWNNNNQQL